MSFTPQLAGSGSYEQVRQLTLTPSAVNSASWSVETYSGTNCPYITDLQPGENLSVTVPFTAAGAAQNNLILVNAQITTTGTLQLVWYNPTNATITPSLMTINLIAL